MFRGPRRRGRGGMGRGGIPMLLLAFQLFQAFSSSNGFLPVTFGAVGINVLAFIQPQIGHFRWPRVQEVCVSTDKVWFDGDWKRLVLAAFFHLDEWHIYYNMASFVWKGISLEKDMGSGYFFSLLAIFVVLTNIVYCALQYAAVLLFHDYSHLYSCAAGFSAVIFAVKVVTTYRLPPGTSYIMGMLPVPSRLAVWAELLVISILIPNASFVGHLAGILVGMAYVMGPLQSIVDYISGWHRGIITAPRYTYAARPTGYRSQPPPTQHTTDDDPELQEAIQRSLAEERPPHNQGPIGFEHLQTTEQDNIGLGHLEREVSDDLQHQGQGSHSDIGFEHLEREGNSSVRHRGLHMSAEQLRAARVARFERNT